MTSQKLATTNRELKHAIVDSGKTQRAIARRARIDETRFSRIISGESAPRPRERKTLARILQRDESALFSIVELAS